MVRATTRDPRAALTFLRSLPQPWAHRLLLAMQALRQNGTRRDRFSPDALRLCAWFQYLVARGPRAAASAPGGARRGLA